MSLTTFVIFIGVYWLIASFIFIYAMRRNERVYEYRERLLKKIHCCSLVDILFDRNPLWRINVLISVRYDEMMFKFWRSLDSFYPDKAFITVKEDASAEINSLVKRYIKEYTKVKDSADLKRLTDDIIRLVSTYAPVIDHQKEKEKEKENEHTRGKKKSSRDK